LNQGIEMLEFMEEGTGRPDVALTIGERVPLRAGPKWMAWITGETPEHKRWRGSPLPPAVAEQLLQLEPANVVLKHLRKDDDGYLATSEINEDHQYRGYARVGLDRTIEMAGVLGAGVWGDALQSWWPGAYELPMLKMLPATIRTLLDQLMHGVAPTLYMVLTDIEGTAIVAEYEGMERPFLIPPGIGQIQFSRVQLDDSPSCRTALTASFNRIREIVGIGERKPFYL
jgi:hypothetical protein